MAPQNDPNNKLNSFIEQVTAGQKLQPLFSFYLPKGQNGKLVFGQYDLAKYAKAGSKQEDIAWSGISNDEKTWSLTFNGLKFKDGAQIATESEKIMLDTGLTYALVPTKDVESLAKSLMGYSLDC